MLKAERKNIYDSYFIRRRKGMINYYYTLCSSHRGEARWLEDLLEK